MGKAIEIAQRTRIEATGPPARIAGHQRPCPRSIAPGKPVGGNMPHQDLILVDSLTEIAVDQPQKRRLGLLLWDSLGAGVDGDYLDGDQEGEENPVHATKIRHPSLSF